MRRSSCALFVAASIVLALFATAQASAQEPPPPPPPEQSNSPAASSSSTKNNKKYSHANDFLIIGTVFTDKGYAFPNVELRIRRSSEKKFRWDSYTNSRGEFAIRVPQGTDYEMIVHAKGFADQTRSVDAKNGLNEARIVFRMELGTGEKK